MNKLEEKVNNFIEKQILRTDNKSTSKKEATDKNTTPNILLSSKYRKYPLNEDIREMLDRKVDYVIKNNKSFIFGTVNLPFFATTYALLARGFSTENERLFN